MKLNLSNPWVLLALAAGGFLLFRSPAFRRRLAAGNRAVSGATGGAVPVVPGLLPDTGFDPGFGVQNPFLIPSIGVGATTSPVSPADLPSARSAPSGGAPSGGLFGVRPFGATTSPISPADLPASSAPAGGVFGVRPPPAITPEQIDVVF